MNLIITNLSLLLFFFVFLFLYMCVCVCCSTNSKKNIDILTEETRCTRSYERISLQAFIFEIERLTRNLLYSTMTRPEWGLLLMGSKCLKFGCRCFTRQQVSLPRLNAQVIFFLIYNFSVSNALRLHRLDNIFQYWYFLRESHGQPRMLLHNVIRHSKACRQDQHVQSEYLNILPTTMRSIIHSSLFCQQGAHNWRRRAETRGLRSVSQTTRNIGFILEFTRRPAEILGGENPRTRQDHFL